MSNKIEKWIVAKRKFKLSDKHIQMARELGLNPDKFGQLNNHKQEPWKAPLKDFIEELYFKQFKKTEPDNIRPIEQIIAIKKNKKEEEKKRQATSMTQLFYIELKSGFEDNGPAWIGKVEYSKSGQTVYFNNKAFKKLKSPGFSSNFYDIETGDEYWISGIKKDRTDRHWAGSGKVMIDKKVIDEYSNYVDFNISNDSKYEPVDLMPNDKKRFNTIENTDSNVEKVYGKDIESAYWDSNKRKLIK